MQDIKIFNLSFHRNATTSFNNFMKDLNYKCIHDTWLSMKKIGIGNNFANNINLNDKNLEPYDRIMKRVNTNELDKLIELYNVFSDNPWPILYKYLDEKYPNAKFILFYRDSNEWLKSVQQYFGNTSSNFRKLLYKNNGSPYTNPDVYIQTYEKHNSDVINYFMDRKDKLLVINLDDNDIEIGKVISDFLNLNINKKFPKMNKSSISKNLRH